MSQQTVAQIESELLKLKQELEKKQQALEAQKQNEIAALKAKREKGIRTAWEQLTKELVKAQLVAQPDSKKMATESGKKRSETTFNKKCLELLSEVLGLSQAEGGAPAGSKQRKRLNEDQKAKIEEWVKEGLTVAVINKKMYSNPTNATYQRVNNYVKKLKNS
jgi:hypothetical protein